MIAVLHQRSPLGESWEKEMIQRIVSYSLADRHSQRKTIKYSNLISSTGYIMTDYKIKFAKSYFLLLS